MKRENVGKLFFLPKRHMIVALFVLSFLLAGNFFINKQFSLTVITILILPVIYLALIFIYKSTKIQKLNQKYLMALIFYYFAYISLLINLEDHTTPIIFLGVILVALTYYITNQQYLIGSILPVISIISISYLIDHESEFYWQNLIELLLIVLVVTLLSIFITGIIGITQSELTEVEELNKAEKFEHQRLLSLINNIGDAVIATDNEGIIQTYNGAALDLLNTNKSLSGVNLAQTWKLIDHDGKTVDLIREIKRLGKNMQRNDLRIEYAKDDTANVYINATPIKIGYNRNSEIGYTFILKDITKQKSLDDERDEFISVVSHELRTPVAITEGKISNTQFLVNQKGYSKRKLNESLDQAHSQVVFLASMINDLATLSRAERHDAEMDLDKINPAEIVENVIKNYQIEAKQANLTLSSHVARQIPQIFTNRLYLLEIIQNFVTNSIKYTKSGGITVSAKADGKDKVIFLIEDTGIGISTSDQKRLFEKFFRSEDYRTRESSGTGLGLYVTMKLAKKLNAEIKVISQLNHGSTFSVSVPSISKSSRKHQASVS